MLTQNQGDLWDSGKVSSDQSIHVVYSGRPLASGAPRNGWDHWFYEDEAGALQPLDALRDRLRSGPGPSDAGPQGSTEGEDVVDGEFRNV